MTTPEHSSPSGSVSPHPVRVRIRTRPFPLVPDVPGFTPNEPPIDLAEGLETTADRPAQEAAYSVGYCQPPIETRFKPGRSANPKGRPKGAKNYRTVLLEELNAKVAVRENGRTKTMAKFHIGMKKLANRFAEHGDVKTLAAIDKLLGVMESANGVTSGAADASPLLAESKIGMLDWDRVPGSGVADGLVAALSGMGPG